MNIMVPIAACILLAPFLNEQQEAEKKREPAAATIEAYEKLGAVYGGWTTGRSGRHFQPGREHARKGIPAFRFVRFPKKLPPVEVPFALDLGNSDVTGKQLKELLPLKNLTHLNLWQTRWRDDDAKTLAGLQQLVSLDAGNAYLSDPGVVELAALKNLTELCVFQSKMTDDGMKALAGLKKLTRLDVGLARKVTAAGFDHLAGLMNLTWLSVYDIEVEMSVSKN